MPKRAATHMTLSVPVGVGPINTFQSLGEGHRWGWGTFCLGGPAAPSPTASGLATLALTMF